MSRPETQGPPEGFYDEREARKYTQSSRIIKIQKEMAGRALELLALPDDGCPRMILDLGCGSGLSGSVLSAFGHFWMGMDISREMLAVAQERLQAEDESGKDDNHQSKVDEDSTQDSEDEYDDSEEEIDENYTDEEDPTKCLGLFHGDMGEGTPFRPGTFDGCISISALQWLNHSNRAHERPKARITRLFTTLFACLARGARAVFQFYPESSSQVDLVFACAMKAGFTGGLVIDFPHSSKAKKYYLCLMTGPMTELPKALTAEGQEHIDLNMRSRKRGISVEKKGKYNKEWVLKKKEAARKKGQIVRADSKYTARRRRIKF